MMCWYFYLFISHRGHSIITHLIIIFLIKKHIWKILNYSDGVFYLLAKKTMDIVEKILKSKSKSVSDCVWK